MFETFLIDDNPQGGKGGSGMSTIWWSVFMQVDLKILANLQLFGCFLPVFLFSSQRIQVTQSETINRQLGWGYLSYLPAGCAVLPGYRFRLFISNAGYQKKTIF